MDDTSKEQEETTTNEIKALDKGVVHRICTGQVILSLAAACKELIENALDAKATIITVRVKDYGLSLLEVIDNGSGITEENFAQLGQAHCTSKLDDFSDLASLSTFGFRGEALNALMALSDLSIVTRHCGCQIAYKLDYDHVGHLANKSACYRQVGTTVSISNFFQPLPVRRKEFENNAKKEFVKLTNLLYAYCIVCTRIRFEFIHTVDGKRHSVVTTYGNSTIKENLSNVYGGKLLDNLLEFKSSEPSEEHLEEFRVKPENVDLNIFNVDGFISCVQQGYNRNTDRQFVFINGRPCEYQKLCRLVNEIYHEYNNKQYPFMVVNIWSKTDMIDVNVTPDKRSIFVSNEALLFAVVKTTLKSLFDKTAGIYKVNDPLAKSQTQLMSSEKNLKRTAITDENVLSTHEDTNNAVASKQLKITDRFRTFLAENSFTNKKMHLDCLSESEYNSSDRTSLKSVRCDSRDTVGTVEEDIANSEQSYTLEFHQRKLSDSMINVTTQNDVRLEEQTLPPIDNFIFGNLPENDLGVTVGNEQQRVVIEKSDFISIDTQSQHFTDNVLLHNDSSNNGSSAIYGTASRTFIVEEPHIGVVRVCRSIPFSFNNLRNRLKNLNDKDELENHAEFHREFRARILPSDNQTAEDELKRCISKDMFNSMRIIGQFNQGFIITHLFSDLFIIDQHASDEKFNYETLKQDFYIETQRLIKPLALDLTAATESVVSDNLEIFRKNGYEFEVFKESDKLQLVSVPIKQSETSSKEDIEDIAFILTDFPGQMYRPPRIHKEMASKACRKSVMIGTVLSHENMKKVVCNMALIEQPWNCPHGRPTMRHLFNLKMLPTND